MGLFSALFASNDGIRVELARRLAISRLGSVPSDQITSEQSDALYAELKRMPAQGILGLPEGTIVTIIQTYSQLIHKRALHEQALLAIENHRQQIGSEQINLKQMSLDDYVAYRLRIELPNGPMPGMDDYWFNSCMQAACQQFRIPWHGGPTEAPILTLRKRRSNEPNLE